MLIGTCPLCRTTGELQSSHYMPASVFRAVASGHAPRDQAPVVINVPEKSAVRTNEQVRLHLLCSSCEGLFGRNGENVVVRQCAQADNKFVLLDSMKAGLPNDVSDGRSVYNGPQGPPGISCEAYLYFGASVFWRGSVARWPQTASYFGALGARNEESFREFLIGAAEFPRQARLFVHVDYQSRTRGLSYFPSCSRDEFVGCRIWRHGFLIPGVKFTLIVGQGLASMPDVGTSSAERVAFFEWHPDQTDFHGGILSQMLGVKPKGTLARRK